MPIHLFVGRKDEVELLSGLTDRVAAGRIACGFVVGERGIGKTSLCSYASAVSARKDLLSVHLQMGASSTLDELVRSIFDKLLRHSERGPWASRVRGLFGGFIREAKAFGIGVTFAPPAQDLLELRRSLASALASFCEHIVPDKRGLLIILDDPAHFAKDLEFANWLKSVIDEMATEYEANLPVGIFLAGTAKDYDSLVCLNPSLKRYFSVAWLQLLRKYEVRCFFEQAFASVGITVDDEAMDWMVYFSDRSPSIMQEIGAYSSPSRPLIITQAGHPL